MDPILKRILATCKHILKEYRKNRSLKTFSLFLLLATILWFGHALNSMRDREIDIPIVYMDVPENVDFVDSLPHSITVHLRDQGKRLRQYTHESFTPIQINLQAQTQAESGQIQLPSEVIRQRVADQLQGTTRLQRIFPENISVGYYKQHQKRVPIRLSADIHLAETYQLVCEPVLSPSSILIFGDKNTLDTITEVQTEAIQIEDVKDTMTLNLHLQKIPTIRFSQPNVQLQLTAESFTEKQFTLPIQIVGTPEGERLRLFPPTADVRVRVSVKHFHAVTEQDLRVECTYPQGDVSHLPLQLQYNSPYITHGRINPTEVEYIIEK